jgi:aspartate racemase
MTCIRRSDWQCVAELMLLSANKLAKIGGDFLICPDNTIHQALPYVEARSPLRWLHIAAVVAAHAVERGFQRLGLIGTRCLVEREVYPERLEIHGLECVRRNAAEREAINRIIFDELVCGVFTADAVAYFSRSLST